MATCLLKGVHLLTFLFLICIIFFSTFFTLAMYKKIKLSFILRWLRLFKGLRLLFLPNVPGATSILESRVCGMHAKSNLIVAYCLPDESAEGLF